MNSKFFDVNKEKQDSIINAALELFAQKGYKDSSTDVIVKAAGISKGLLFHYFGSKQGLYSFICDYSTRYMTLELTRTVKSTEKDFFSIISQIELGKTRVARNYPYMHLFLRSIRFEKDKEATDITAAALDYLDTTYKNIYSQISTKKFINPDESEKVIEIIQWINDGFIKEKLSEGNLTPDEAYEEFSGYLSMLRNHFYKSESNDMISVAKEEVLERNETIMDGLRMEMTFEERLMAGKRPLVEVPDADNNAEQDDAGDSTQEMTSSNNDNASVVLDNKDDGKVSGAAANSENNKQSIDEIIMEAENNLEKNDKE